jgi:acyl-CoA dehydrogenase
MIEEQVKIVDTSFGFVPGSLNAPHFLHVSASREQSAKWLPGIARGEKLLAVAITEPNAGTDVKAIRATARREGDEYVLNGSKTFITHGYLADWCLVVARTGAAGAKGLTMFMVDTKTPGYKVGRILDKIGQTGVDTCEVFLDDVRVPAENIVGGHGEGKAFAQLMNCFVNERLSIGLTAVASMEKAVELTIEYAKERKLFNEPLLKFQNTRFKLAECQTEAYAARIFIDNLICRLVDGERLDNATAAMAKWWCTQKQCEVVDECLQLFGGYGYMTEYPIAKLYLDARVQKIYGGTNEVMKELIARDM